MNQTAFDELLAHCQKLKPNAKRLVKISRYCYCKLRAGTTDTIEFGEYFWATTTTTSKGYGRLNMYNRPFVINGYATRDRVIVDCQHQFKRINLQALVPIPLNYPEYGPHCTPSHCANDFLAALDYPAQQIKGRSLQLEPHTAITYQFYGHGIRLVGPVEVTTAGIRPLEPQPIKIERPELNKEIITVLGKIRKRIKLLQRMDVELRINQEYTTSNIHNAWKTLKEFDPTNKTSMEATIAALYSIYCARGWHRRTAFAAPNFFNNVRITLQRQLGVVTFELPDESGNPNDQSLE